MATKQEIMDVAVLWLKSIGAKIKHVGTDYKAIFVYKNRVWDLWAKESTHRLYLYHGYIYEMNFYDDVDITSPSFDPNKYFVEIKGILNTTSPEPYIF